MKNLDDEKPDNGLGCHKLTTNWYSVSLLQLIPTKKKHSKV